MFARALLSSLALPARAGVPEAISHHDLEKQCQFFVEEIVGQQVKVKLAGHEYRKKFWEKNDQGRSGDEVWPIGNKGH